ncbi:hypothetical protein GCM10027594_31970 [Hymenobacter agri]
MPRILAIDYGNKRVGLAVTDPLGMIASPLDTIHSKDLLAYVKAYHQREPLRAVVVGMPRTLLNEPTDVTSAVVGLLHNLDKLPPHVCALHVALSVAAVVLAWLLVHLVFTLRYAHAYYDRDEETGHDVGGLVFPDDQNDQGETRPRLKPNYIDFAYFSFVIGMTAQTADIAIANRELRGTALLHGCVSFLFNTVIVALTIGTVGGLLN